MGKANMRPAFYDELTGLPHLNLLKDILAEYILKNSCDKLAGEDKFVLAYLDINQFSYMNETYGYRICDEVIKCVSDYLNSKVQKPNFVTRITSDKFVILFTDITSEDELYEIVEDIISNGCHVSICGHMLYITMSAGIAFYPEHGMDIATLIKKAEVANYFAKKSERDINIYSDELQKNIVEQIQMMSRLQTSIEKEEFALFFQPEYSLNTNEIIGVEALVRWPQPVNGFISPDIFIPVAEKSKQIYLLERWIVNKALQQKEQWEHEGLGHIELSINLSSKTLESEANFQKIEEIISSYNVNYSQIVFEITETVILSQLNMAIERLNRLRSYGIKIALDDFGTGYSSLTHIMKLPIDIIKIDRSFIQSIPHGNEETAITQNIISLAHDLNYRVVAEGIETQEQLDFLKKISCERGQGFLLCKPITSEQLEKLLAINL